MEFHAWMLHMVISMVFHDISMDIPWHSIYSDHTGKIRTMELTDFMGNPYIPHGIHIFLMEFHEFPMGYSWVISIRETPEVPGPIAAKLCHMIGIWRQPQDKVQKFGGRSPKNIGAKNMQNFGQFFTTSDFHREYLQNEATHSKSKKTRTRATPPAFNEKSPVNFGPPPTENCMWVWTL